ncbi:hypothetical protein CHS0354_016643 [Potamilus streckersoni]|uniref:Uncharacterized protein n=1 Tax=Potamilus streckersoni TaxID=2493646 RepID=A0AAE0WDA1_9BIVA|nr:hypothetical protein CHS0354_016643 [Potamilus streckersoni]
MIWPYKPSIAVFVIIKREGTTAATTTDTREPTAVTEPERVWYAIFSLLKPSPVRGFEPSKGPRGPDRDLDQLRSTLCICDYNLTRKQPIDDQSCTSLGLEYTFIFR